MEDIPILGNNRESAVFNETMAMYGAPAYVRRARQMEQAWTALVEHCGRRRDEELAMVRLRLGVLAALAGNWQQLRPHVANDEQLTILQRMHAELNPQLRQPVEPTSSPRKLRHALQELVESLERFNQRWRTLLAKIDFTEVNRLREGYNRFYVVEKECALRSPHVARQGFRPLAPATTAELAALWPVLAVPAN